MTLCEWIVCERTGRWAAALRVAAARDPTMPSITPRLREVRSLSELAARLAESPYGLALVEVWPANLGDVLAWLTEAAESHPHARFVALLDGALTQRHASSAAENCDMAGALAEAGAAEIARSPRRLQHVLLIARQHAAILARHVHDRYSQDQSIVASAFASLPWQDAPRRLG